MEESSDLYDVYETDIHPPWADHQHQSLEDPENVECLRRKIKYYFMNPCEKYHARGRKPWKLILQIIKIAIITIQVVISCMTWMFVILLFHHLDKKCLFSVPVGVFWAEQPDGCHIQGGKSDDIQAPLPEKLCWWNYGYVCCLQTGRCLWSHWLHLWTGNVMPAFLFISSILQETWRMYDFYLLEFVGVSLFWSCGIVDRFFLLLLSYCKSLLGFYYSTCLHGLKSLITPMTKCNLSWDRTLYMLFELVI